MRFDDKRWLVQLKTHILPQDPHQTPVCKWSALCVLLFFTQNIRRTCTQGYVFNTINSVYWFIKGFLSETGILLLLSVSGSEKHCDDWQAGFPESWVTPRHQQFFLSLLLWKWKSLKSPLTLCNLSMEFSRPEYWSGYFPSPGDHPNPGIEPRSPALQVDSLPAEPQGKPVAFVPSVQISTCF